ncbi:MAG: M20/M25/M40 family metallo-hydrolase [Candidatus Binatia bacterium]
MKARYIENLVIVACVSVVTVAVLLPGSPTPLPADAPLEQFSAERAMAVLRDIASEPHPTGSAAQDTVRELLFQQLQGLGLNPQIQPWTIRTRPWGEEHERTVVGYNMLVRLSETPSEASSGAILFVCHYDSVAEAPGAGDDGAAVAAFVEALRALRYDPPRRNTLVFLFTDGEEIGLLGAKALADEHPWMTEVKLVFNFEARGASGESILFETGSNSGVLVREYAKAVSWPFAFSLGTTVYRHLPHDTDFSVFRQRGLPGLNFAFIGSGTSYHQASDVPGNLDARSLQHHGSYVLALARHFGALDLASVVPQAGCEMTFFTLPGNVLLSYAKAWDLWLGYGVVALVVTLVFLTLAQQLLSVRQLVIGLLLWPFSVVGVGLVIFIPIWLSGRLGQVVSGEPVTLGTHWFFASGGLTILGAGCWAASCLCALAYMLSPSRTVAFAISTAVNWALVVIISLQWVAGITHALAWPLLLATVLLTVWLHIPKRKTHKSVSVICVAGVLLLIFWLSLLRQLHQVGSVHPLFSVAIDAAGLAFVGPFFFPFAEFFSRGRSWQQLVILAVTGLVLLTIAVLPLPLDD